MLPPRTHRKQNTAARYAFSLYDVIVFDNYILLLLIPMSENPIELNEKKIIYIRGVLVP